jgi:hypothetical protein
MDCIHPTGLPFEIRYDIENAASVCYKEGIESLIVELSNIVYRKPLFLYATYLPA